MFDHDINIFIFSSRYIVISYIYFPFNREVWYQTEQFM